MQNGVQGDDIDRRPGLLNPTLYLCTLVTPGTCRRPRCVHQLPQLCNSLHCTAVHATRAARAHSVADPGGRG